MIAPPPQGGMTDLPGSGRAADPFLRRLMKENVVLLVVAMLVVMPLMGPFIRGGGGLALRNGLFYSIGVLLLAVLLARVEVRGGLPRFLYLLRTGVNAPLIAFLLWIVLRALWTPGPGERVFAAAELLRLGSGVLVYFAVALYLESRSQLSLLTDCLLGLIILSMGYELVVRGSALERGLSALFLDRQPLAAILALLFPLLLSLAMGLAERGRRMVAIVAVVLCGIGLLFCLDRTAWAGTLVGTLVWLVLAGPPLLVAHSGRSRRPSLVLAASLLLIAAGFVSTTHVDALVANRSQQIMSAMRGRDESFAWRVQKWRGTLAMVARRPVWGWGPGQFVLHQEAYTHSGRTPEEVRRDGPSFSEMAYNEYLQTAAELGLVGLALYLLLLACFFSKARQALRRLPHGFRRTVLVGCMAGIAAQMVDALSTGCWHYAECAVFFWLVLGLGVAVTRMAYRTPTSPSPRPA
jgi:O-antigen ligase